MEHPKFPEDLPVYLKVCIRKVLFDFPDCYNGNEIRGCCYSISDRLKDTIESYYPSYDSGGVDGWPINGEPHYWLMVGDWNIDLSYRQFDQKADCPKIWKDEPAPNNCAKEFIK